MASGPEHAGREHFGQEQREWVVQCVAWTVMALILVAALFGAFGNGPLSKRTAVSEGGGLRVEYQRVVRFQAQTVLRLRIDAVSGGEVTVTFGEGYLDQFEFESVVPEPREQRSGDGHVVMVFEPVRAGEPIEVTFRGKVEKLGSLTGVVSLGGRGGVPQRVRLEQFALP